MKTTLARSGLAISTCFIAALLACAIVDNAHADKDTVKLTPLDINLELAVLGETRPQSKIAWKSLSSGFIEPKQDLHSQVLQRLRALRIKYRQMGLKIRVQVTTDDKATRKLGDELTQMLASAYLATSATAEISPTAPEKVKTGIVISGSRGDRPIIYDFLQALVPYFSGTVLLRFDNTLKPATLLLAMNGEPFFAQNGRVYFPFLGEKLQ